MLEQGGVVTHLDDGHYLILTVGCDVLGDAYTNHFHVQYHLGELIQHVTCATTHVRNSVPGFDVVMGGHV